MSASREKKQRQSAGPDSKALKAQQEQAARRRTTIIYSVIAAVIAVMVIALLVWRSGFFQARASAATLGDETLSTAELSFYYYDARSYYAAYGILDSSKSDDEQYYNESENKTYRDYFMEEALKSAQQSKALAEQAVKDGHTEDEVKDTVKAYVDSVKAQAASSGISYGAYLKAQFGPYMTAGTFEKLYTRLQMASLAANDKYDALFDGYTQDELDAYYKDNADSLDTIEYSYLYFAIPTVNEKDEQGNDLAEDELNKRKEEAQANAKKDAEDALKAVEDGSTFQSQADKYELTTSSYADHAKVVGTSTIDSAYSEQLLKLGQDECELVETDKGYYVISFHSRYLADEVTRDVRHILAMAESTTGEDNKLVPPTDEAWAAAKAKMDEIQKAWDESGKTEDDFAKLANEKSDDGGSNTNGGLYERNPKGQFVPEFDEWVFDSARKSGDVGMVQHSAEEGATSGYYGYHLIYYVGENEPVWMGSARKALATQAQQTWIEELAEGYPTALTGGADYLGK